MSNDTSGPNQALNLSGINPNPQRVINNWF